MAVKHFRLELEDDLHTKVKLTAVKEGLTMHQIIVKAIEEYLEKAQGRDEE